MKNVVILISFLVKGFYFQPNNQTVNGCIKCFCLFPQTTPSSNVTTTTTNAPCPSTTTPTPTTSPTTTTPVPTTSTFPTTTTPSTTTTSPLIYNELNCVFPFQMYGAVYDKCVTFDNGITFWCSLDRVYSTRAAQCKESCPQLAKDLVSGTQEIHSACLEPSKNAFGLIPTLNQSDQILRIHNTARSQVRPSSSDMKKMTWDFGLARLAQRWAENCNFNHDCDLCRRLLNNQTISVGQNAFAILGGDYNPNTFWPEVIEYWLRERSNFQFAQGSRTGNFQDVGHYTQIINSRSSKIGCGAAKCNENLYAYCNYAFGQKDWKEPYEKGIGCSQCSRTNCENNLCNCSKLCQNSGILDSVKCECKCTEKFSGEFCEIS